MSHTFSLPSAKHAFFGKLQHLTYSKYLKQRPARTFYPKTQSEQKSTTQRNDKRSAKRKQMSRSRGHCSSCRSLLVSSATTSQTWRLKLATKTVLRIHSGGAERRNQAGREGLNRLQRPRAEITTACCADGGDNTLQGEENAASVSLTSARSH